MTIEERLEALERELESTKRRAQRLWIGLGLAAFLTCTLAWSFTATTAASPALGAEKVIRANRFIVEDANGKTRASLDTNGLGLLDENGEVRSWLTIDEHGSKLGLFDENGKGRAWLGTDGLGLLDENGKIFRTWLSADGLTLFDENGMGRAWLTTDENGPRLVLFEKDGKTVRAWLRTNGHGSNLALFDENGKTRTILDTFSIGLLDKNGNTHVWLGTDEHGSRLMLFDKNGKGRAVLGTDEYGNGLALYDESGKVIWRAP